MKPTGKLLYEEPIAGFSFRKARFIKAVLILYTITTLLLIGPDGCIYKCHNDLYAGDETNALGRISDGDLTISEDFHTCSNFGFCNPCDVQVKFDRYGQWGYCAVEIRKSGIEVNRNTVQECWDYSGTR